MQAFERQGVALHQNPVTHTALARGHQLALEVREIGAQGAHSLCGRSHCHLMATTKAPTQFTEKKDRGHRKTRSARLKSGKGNG
jgi:hypothetical protein